MQIGNIILELNSDNSKNFKQDVLQKYKDNEVFKNVLSYTFDIFKRFNIKKIPSYIPHNSHYTPMSWEETFHELDKLINREYTGHAGINHLTNILESALEPEIVELIILKDLKSGISAKSINKVFRKLIPVVPYMRCDTDESRIVYPAIAQLKADGMFNNIIVKTNSVDYLSRAGNPLDLKNYFDEELLVMREKYGEDFVFTGELVIEENGKILDRKTGNGILSKFGKGTGDPSYISKIRIRVWDIIPYDKWLEGKYDVEYKLRLQMVKDLIEKSNTTAISVIDGIIVTSYKEAQKEFERRLKNGEEGVILKNLSGFWADKTSKDQIKMKETIEFELVVTGWYGGKERTINEGYLGGLIAESACGKLQARIGSGFSQEDRGYKVVNLNTGEKEDIYTIYTTDEIIGKIITIATNQLITSKNSNVVKPYLPRFIELRDLEKDEADTLEEIKKMFISK